MSTMLVTGGSGFIGGHCILQLLGAGHRVRTAVPNPEREADVRRLILARGANVLVCGDRLPPYTAGGAI